MSSNLSSTKMFEQQLGDRCRDARRRASLTLTQLAKQLGSSVYELQKLEEGNNASLQTFIAVTEFFGEHGWLESFGPAKNVYKFKKQTSVPAKQPFVERRHLTVVK